MMSNLTMTPLIALYFALTGFILAAFQAHRHSVAAVASLHLPR